MTNTLYCASVIQHIVKTLTHPPYSDSELGLCWLQFTPLVGLGNVIWLLGNLRPIFCIKIWSFINFTQFVGGEKKGKKNVSDTFFYLVFLWNYCIAALNYQLQIANSNNAELNKFSSCCRKWPNPEFSHWAGQWRISCGPEIK